MKWVATGECAATMMKGTATEDYRGSDRGDRDGYGRGYYDEDRPRRRMKVCFEYENGDEYCRYRE